MSALDAYAWRLETNAMPIGHRMSLAHLLIARLPIYTPVAQELLGRAQQALDAASGAAATGALATLIPVHSTRG